MIRRIVFTALMLIMAPVFAFAGTYSIAVTSGSTTGTVGPAPLSGYASTAKSFTATAAANYTLSTVTRNGVDVTTNVTYVTGSGPWTVNIPLSTTSQTFYVNYKKNVQVTPTLSAVLPATITIPVGTPTALSGAGSTISNLNTGTQATFAFSGTGLTFAPASGQVTDPINISTNVTAAASGTYTGTLTLSAPNGAGTVTSSANVIITVQPAGVVASNACLACHTGWQQATNYAGSVHANSSYSTCAACHNNNNTQNHPFDVNSNTVDPATFVAFKNLSSNSVLQGGVFCTACHNGSHAIPHAVPVANNTCVACHTSTGTGDAHSISSGIAKAGCVDCHAGAQSAVAGLVNDNNGVRAIIPEFQKTSHHIYNGPTANPANAQCGICHLEGKVVNGTFVVDSTKHMADSYVHLRNADDDSDFAWDPMTPNHTGMDNYCFSCHDANGATSTGIQAIQAVINAAPVVNGAVASAGNPFGDLLSNKYDQVTRAAVVNVFDAMDPANASHHAVRAPKYNTRSTATAIANGTMVAGQSTLFDGGLFVSDYTPLGASLSVADDSQLHCGDCHTVGQWKNDNTKYSKAAIGAHGSVNEYMLRNNLGTDALHNGTTYVCFNCHNDKAGPAGNASGGYYAGYTAAGTSPATGHMNGIHAGTNGCLQNTAGNVGNAIATTGRLGGNMLQLNNTGTAVSKGGTQGNITGIACTNCHNAGIRNATAGQGYSNANTGFGGIHGGNATYTDSNGGQQAPARFMSGMGNFKYIPPANTFNTTTAAGQPATTKGATPAAGLGSCYTNANTTDNAGYSSCNHHGTGTTIQRVGGTVGNVTRPLSY